MPPSHALRASDATSGDPTLVVGHPLVIFEATTLTGRDGLVKLDQACWVAIAKYNQLFATGIGILTVVSRTALSGNELLLLENGVLALLFGTVQTYAWLSA